jgi:Beta-propeller repeat
MVNVATAWPRLVTRAICLRAALVGCALAALTFFLPTRYAQNGKSKQAIGSEPRPQTTGNSRAMLPIGATTESVDIRRGTPLGRPEPAARARLVETYGKLPLRFEVNQGQADREVKFVSRGRGYSVFLTGSEAVLALRAPSAMAATTVGENLELNGLLFGPDGFGRARASRNQRPQSLAASAVHMKLVGANSQAPVAGLDELSGKSNYFVGNDPEKWRTNVSTYAKVRYKGVYPGVDLVYHGNQGQLEYDLVVAPGADPRVITLEVKPQHSGLERLRGQTGRDAWIDADGNLVLPTEGGEVRFHKPMVYQLISGKATSGKATSGKALSARTSRNYIESRYVLRDEDRVGFEVAAYDADKALIIDPVLSYSSYLGGRMDDFGNAITVDSDGNIYVTGGTTSANFFTTPSAYQVIYAGDMNGGYQSVVGDVFVTKLNPSGSAVVYSTYLGGAGGDNAYAIAVDAAKNVYLTGGTNSLDFPVTPVGVYRPTSGVGLNDVFVTKLNASGSALVYSTHIGVGGEGIRGFGIDVDSAGNAYVAGGCGPGFPTTPGAFQTGSSAFSSAFVMKLNPSGTAAVYSTFLSGGGIDYANSLAVDKNGNAYVTGYASSASFPTTSGGFQTVLGGGVDAFVTVVNPAGSGLVYSTFLGGTGNEDGRRIAVDSFGMAYVAGVTSSSNFPTTSGAFQTAYGGGNADAFIAKLDPAKSGPASLIYSTYLGGSGDENAANFPRGVLAVDNAGNAHVTGTTTSTDFPTVNSIQPGPVGGFHAYVAKLNAAGSKLIYSTYLGGSGGDRGHGIYVDSGGNAFVTGQTWSLDFPLTSNAFQPAPGGSSDAFVVKIIPVASLSPAKLTFANLAVGGTSGAQVIVLTNERNTPLNIANISASGDFAQTNICGTSLGAGLTCNISVTFSPTAPLNRTGSITVTDDASNSPQMVALNGIGVGPAVTFGGGPLGGQLVGTSSAGQAISLTNSGNAPLTISSIAISGTNSGDFAQTNTCPASNATLAANANCTISVSFTPAVTGNRAASITVTDNAPGSPHSFSLTGTGTDFSLAAAAGSNCPSGGNCSTSATISAGQMASYNLQITPNSGFNGAVALACTGAPGGATCSISPPSLPANGPYAFVVMVTNTSNVLVAPPLQMPHIPALPMAYAALVLLFLLAVTLLLRAGFASDHPKRVFTTATALLVLGLLHASGCGGGRTVQPPSNATLTISGVSAGVSRTASLSLTVNH